MRKIINLVFSLTISWSTSHAFASTQQETNAKEAGKNEANQVVLSMKNNDTPKPQLQSSLKQLFKIVVYRLKQRGFADEANQIHREWQQINSFYFQNNFELSQLGDHAPLSQWLANTYNRIEKLIGPRLCSIYHFDDVKIINYGFPVSFSPGGNPANGLAWGKNEYLAHFVPLAGAISYWTGDAVCEAALDSIASMICSSSMEIARFNIEQHLAPWIGEQIYLQYNSEEKVPRPSAPVY